LWLPGDIAKSRQDLAHDQKMSIWSRADSNPADLQAAGSSLAQILGSYQSFFGRRGKSNPPLWIVECPAEFGCLPQQESGFSSLLFAENAEASVQMISEDTVLVDSQRAKGMPEVLATPALAAGWLATAKNPGFYQQPLPGVRAPGFCRRASSRAFSGAANTRQIISRALAQIPPDATRVSNNDPNVARAKSLLLFYALQERVGAEAFQNAVQHMLAARSGRDFELADLIAALGRNRTSRLVRLSVTGSSAPVYRKIFGQNILSKRFHKIHLLRRQRNEGNRSHRQGPEADRPVPRP